jgi:N-methylhydantoinase A
MPLNSSAARRAYEPIAARLGFSLERTAHGVLSIVASNMVRALRSVSVEKGHDPRNFVLVAFGGAGPLHASDVARSLGIRELLIPPAPGILCAQGLVVSELREEFVGTLVTPLDGYSRKAIDKQLGSLLSQASIWFDREAAPPESRHLSVQLEMRFKGQNFELPVKLDIGKDFEPEIPEDGPLKQRFLERHRQTYGYADSAGQVEIVNYRVSAFARFKRLASLPDGGRQSGAPRGVPQRIVYFDFQSPLMTPVYWRPDIPCGREIAGPAIVEQLDSTTLIFPGDRAMVDDAGNIMIEIGK